MYHKIIHIYIQLNWFLLKKNDFAEIEQMIVDIFCHVKEKHNFQNLKTLFDIAYVPYCLNEQGRLDETCKRLFFWKAVSVPYKNGHLIISIWHNKTAKLFYS